MPTSDTKKHPAWDDEASDKLEPTRRRYLDEIQLAERLNLSVQFLRKRRERHEPPFCSKFGRRVRYSIAEIERYEAAALQSAAPQSRLPGIGGAR